MGPKERVRTIRIIAKAEKRPQLARRLGIEIKEAGNTLNSFGKKENEEFQNKRRHKNEKENNKKSKCH